MAEAMIEVALGTLSSLIHKELVSFLGVDEEMRGLSSVLTTIKAVLEDAEEKQLTDKALKDWLRKLRDAAHLLDDVLDEISTHALSLEYQHKVQSSCLYSFNPAHVKFRYKMAKKLKDISQRLDEIAEERSKFHLCETVHERRNQVMEWRQTSSIITQPQFYGRDADKEKIVNFLIDGASNLEDVSVYPIIGIGGLGKTTLAQQVFNDERVVHHFELRIWVCVSEDFNLKRLSKAIIESATRQDCRDSELEPLQRKLQEEVGSKRYLLVLDDVWNDNQEKWDKLRYVLACGSKGASILVTTRLAKVAYITGTTPPHDLSLLSTDDCWELLKQRAFGPHNEERAELVAIGRKIAEKCKGVPLAAKTLGSLLRFQSDEKDWIHIKDSGIWNLPQEEDSILPALRLSYFNLPTKLRQCFAFLAVFPKDERMDKRQVIELWMANGFISTHEGCEVEDEGDRVWNELYLRSFFEDVEIDDDFQVGNTLFKMHDLVHDLAQFVMEEECCNSPSKTSPLSERTRHLSFSRYERYDNVKCLKTVISLGSYVPCSCDMFMRCCHLRALDYEHLHELPSSFGQLKHLRYLNLSYGSFTGLPDSICRLWNLQILNLTDCWELQKLPNQLKCLKSLRHLYLIGCHSLSILSPEMGQLTCLKTLSIYIVSTQKGFLMEELGNLKLEGTLHIKHLERVTSVMDAKKSNLACKRLNNLGLLWERNQQSQSQEDQEKILEVLQPHTQLKTLRISEYLGARLPQWMVNPVLKDLYHLELEECINLFCISSLAKLPSLKRLRLSYMNSVLYMDDGSYVDRGFRALADLTLTRLPSLVKLSREDVGNMFPHLSKLEINDCPQLINVPFLPSVTTLNVSGECSKELLLSIQNLPNLESLEIFKDEKVTSFPNEMLGGSKCLKTLHFYELLKLEALPLTGLANLKALEYLHICSCNKLEMITEEVLQGLYSLKRFSIRYYPEFKLSADFRHLVSLEELIIAECPKVEELHALQHIVTLRSLYLEGLPNLASLPDWLGNLRSLKSLIIIECPKLMSLPMSMQSLTNLKYLKIVRCPELEKRCEEETGADWYKIAYVPYRDSAFIQPL